MKPFALVFFLSVFCLVAGNVLPTHEDCLLPIENGICFTAFASAVPFPRFAYDVQKRKCVRFTHTGCFGNANNFETREECAKKCMNNKRNSAPVLEHKLAEAKPADTTKIEHPTHEDCLLSIDPGTCNKAYFAPVIFPRFAYDVEIHKCVRFYSTGCSGNANNFKTREECVDTCMDEKRNSAPLVEHKVAEAKTENTTKTEHPNRADCLLPPISGICTTTSEVFPVANTFAYIADMNICTSVINVGCLQNANSFKTPADCINKCVI